MAIETYKYNLKVRNGRTVRKKWTFLTKNELDELEPIDTTDWEALLQYRATIDSATPAGELSTDDNTIIFGGDNGEMEIVFSTVATAAMTLKKYEYDLRITYPNGEVDYPLAGQIKVTKSVTRD